MGTRDGRLLEMILQVVKKAGGRVACSSRAVTEDEKVTTFLAG